MGMFRSKVAGVFGAAVLLGVVAGTLAVFTALHPLAGPSGSAAALAAADEATSTASASSSPTGGSSSPVPTATIAAPTATRTPRPTPTPFPPGTKGTLNGRVVSVNAGANSFVLSVSGLHYTCDVTTGAGGTTFSGVTTTFAGLQQGMGASVQGMMQTYPDFAATIVTTYPGDN